jgi:hypothetical protein
MADWTIKKIEIRFVGQRLASKINSSSVMIVTDVIKCDRFATNNSEVTNRLIKNAIEFVALLTPERTETSQTKTYSSAGIPADPFQFDSLQFVLLSADPSDVLPCFIY